MNFKSTDELIFISKEEKLYGNLIKQLNKDFQLANVNLEFDEDVLPSSLKLLLHETIYTLIQEKFTDYLNLLYIIDVPEHEIKKLDNKNLLELSENVTFLILLREWKKVWYRNQFH